MGVMVNGIHITLAMLCFHLKQNGVLNQCPNYLLMSCKGDSRGKIEDNGDNGLLWVRIMSAEPQQLSPSDKTK